MILMRRKVLLAFGIVLFSAACFLALRNFDSSLPEEGVAWAEPKVLRDLSDIQIDTLRILVLEDPLTWEVRPGAVSGLEHDLIRRFAKTADLNISFIPMNDPDSMLLALQLGKGDLMAAQLVMRNDYSKWVKFSRPYREVRLVLAVLREDPIPARAMDGPSVRTALDTIEISHWSPFAIPGYDLAKGVLADHYIRIERNITPEDLLMEVVMGRHHAAIISDARAAYEAGRFPVLDFEPLDCPDQKLRFAMRKNAPELRKALDSWLTDKIVQGERELFMKAYASKIPEQGPLRIMKGIPVSGDSISPFDAEFQRHAANSGWDWELLAALAYKESRFDSNAVSHKGARGLMQIMPRTALRLGLDSSMMAGDHIEAATRFLNRLDTLWMRAVPDRTQRMRFMLASYNAGPGHIVDAQRLAEKLGFDPERWDHNVERAVLLLSKPRYYMDPTLRNGYCNGSQVFHYVRDIESLYRKLKQRKRVVTRAPEQIASGTIGDLDGSTSSGPSIEVSTKSVAANTISTVTEEELAP